MVCDVKMFKVGIMLFAVGITLLFASFLNNRVLDRLTSKEKFDDRNDIREKLKSKRISTPQNRLLFDV
jgi:hypothetical protein